MTSKPLVFMDTSALFTAIWSDRGGGRMILKLGEAGLVSILVGSHVLNELEDVLRRKAPQSLGDLALLLDCCQVSVIKNIDENIKIRCMELVNHRGDALILADAICGKCDYFVTLDREHFLNNPNLVEYLSFPMGTPGDFIDWLRGQIDTGFPA